MLIFEMRLTIIRYSALHRWNRRNVPLQYVKQQKHMASNLPVRQCMIFFHMEYPSNQGNGGDFTSGEAGDFPGSSFF